MIGQNSGSRGNPHRQGWRFLTVSAAPSTAIWHKKRFHFNVIDLWYHNTPLFSPRTVPPERFQQPIEPSWFS
jgi:hypothetical protein